MTGLYGMLQGALLGLVSVALLAMNSKLSFFNISALQGTVKSAIAPTLSGPPPVVITLARTQSGFLSWLLRRPPVPTYWVLQEMAEIDRYFKYFHPPWYETPIPMLFGNSITAELLIKTAALPELFWTPPLKKYENALPFGTFFVDGGW